VKNLGYKSVTLRLTSYLILDEPLSLSETCFSYMLARDNNSRWLRGLSRNSCEMMDEKVFGNIWGAKLLHFIAFHSRNPSHMDQVTEWSFSRKETLLPCCDPENHSFFYYICSIRKTSSLQIYSESISTVLCK
jgi:hypothetical protein